MGIKITTIAESINDNGLKALVHAPAGTGKTVLGATAKAKTLIISAESGLLSLGQDQQNLIAAGSPDFAPEFCSVVEVTTIADLSDVYDHLCEDTTDDEGNVTHRKALTDYEWVVLDSITEIAEQVLDSEKKKSKDPRKAYGELQVKMLAILKSFRDLPKYNVLMTCKQERKVDDTSGVTMYQPMMPGAKLSQQIPYIFDEVWCLRVGKDDEGNAYHYVQAVRELQYECKDRSGKLSDCEPPSLAMLHAKIYGKDGTSSADDGQNNEGDLVDNSSGSAPAEEGEKCEQSTGAFDSVGGSELEAAE